MNRNIQSQEALLAPMPVEEFHVTRRRRKAFLQKGTPGRFDDLFSLASIDQMLPLMVNSAEDCFFFRASENVSRLEFSDEKGNIQLNKLIALYREGGTLHLRNIQRVLPKLDALWRDMTMRNRAQVQINFWQTRQNNLTPFLHYDTHDIFVLQIHGDKDWTLYEHAPELLAPRNPDVTLERDQVSKASERMRMAPGDLLYIPAGTPHEVTTCAPHSVHLAIGVHHVLWRDVMDIALSVLDQRGTRLTEAVPFEMLDQEPDTFLAKFQESLQAAMAELDGRYIQDTLSARYLQTLTPPFDDHFTREVMNDDSITAECKLRRRADLPCMVLASKDAGISEILFAGGGGVEGPADIEHLLRFVADARGPITAYDLPHDYDIGSRLTLLAELLQLGLLERA